MPRLITHPLGVVSRERQREVITRSVILEPAERRSEFKTLGKIGGGFITVPEVDSQPRAVLGVSRGCTHLGPLTGCLIPLRFHIKKDALLKLVGAITTQQTQVDTVRSSSSLHRLESLSSIGMKLKPRRNLDQVENLCFVVRKVSQQAAIQRWPFIDAFHSAARGGEACHQIGAEHHSTQ